MAGLNAFLLICPILERGTLRRSFDTAAGTSALHVVTAFAAHQRLILAQVATKPGQNEVIAARDVLRLLNLQGMLVTADAIHCNSQTAGLIRERGAADWLCCHWPGRSSGRR